MKIGDRECSCKSVHESPIRPTGNDTAVWNKWLKVISNEKATVKVA